MFSINILTWRGKNSASIVAFTLVLFAAKRNHFDKEQDSENNGKHDEQGEKFSQESYEDNTKNEPQSNGQYYREYKDHNINTTAFKHYTQSPYFFNYDHHMEVIIKICSGKTGCSVNVIFSHTRRGCFVILCLYPDRESVILNGK